MNNCNFCKKDFKTIFSLKKHQLVAKYCLKIQGVLSEEGRKKEIIYKCNDCLTTFATKKNLESHIHICKVIKQKKDKEKDKENEKLKEEINKRDRELQKLKEDMQINELNLKSQIVITEAKLEMYKSDHECIQEIAKQPKVSKVSRVSNIMNNKYNYLSPLNLTREDAEDIVERNFTTKYFLDGQKGVADFTYENILLDENNNSKLVCTDVSRHKFMSKNKDGNIENDYKANNLLDITHPPILKKSQRISTALLNNNPDDNLMKIKCLKNFNEIKSLKTTASEYISQLTYRTMKTPSPSLINTDIASEGNTKTEVSIYDYTSESENEGNSYPIYLTNDYMAELSQFLAIEHLLHGLDGLVLYALDYPFKNTIYCSDISTKKLNYKISEDNLLTDTGGESVCRRFFKSIEKKYIQLYKDFRLKIEDSIQELTNSAEEFETTEKMDEILAKIDELNLPLEMMEEDYYEIKKIFNGKSTEFLSKFINEICLQTMEKTK